MNDQTQYQSSNTPEFWANTAWRVFNQSASGELPKALEGVVKANMQQWVVDIREDEINAIIREIDQQQMKSERLLSGKEVLDLLRARLPARR